MNSFPLIALNEIDSTNNYTKALLMGKEVNEFTVVTSEYQLAGKGQRGNYWESERGKNLTFSIILKPSFLAINKQFMLSKIVCLAMHQTLSRYIESPHLKIKWPNDIYYKDFKIAGILIEHDLLGNQIESSIVGIGLNVNQTSFISDAPNPISLNNICRQTFDKSEILNYYINSLKSYYRLLKNREWEQINARYHQILYRNQEQHIYEDNNGRFIGKIRSVDEDGTINIEKENKVAQYLFKEVKYII